MQDYVGGSALILGHPEGALKLTRSEEEVVCGTSEVRGASTVVARAKDTRVHQVGRLRYVSGLWVVVGRNLLLRGVQG